MSRFPRRRCCIDCTKRSGASRTCVSTWHQEEHCVFTFRRHGSLGICYRCTVCQYICDVDLVALAFLVIRIHLLGSLDLLRHCSAQVSRARCSICGTHRQTWHGLDRLYTRSIWPCPCQCCMEQRATLRLGHASRVLPPDHRPLVSCRVRLGRSACSVTTNPSVRLDKTGGVYYGTCRYRMGIFRHLDSLLLAILVGSSRTDTADNLSRVCTCVDLRSTRSWCYRVHAHPHSCLVHHHGFHAGVLRR
jgi:hypothetical protein